MSSPSPTPSLGELKPLAIHFGAGNIGRGFIGPILVDSGFHVVFADVNKGLIDKINEAQGYDVHILDTHEKEIAITDVSAVLTTTYDIIREIADPRTEIITTAVGVGILDRIAPTIARGISDRKRKGGKTLNIIACENTIGASARLKTAVEPWIAPEDQEYLDEYIGFANCSVDRIVPPFVPKSDQNSLDVGVEGFHEWVVEEPSLKGDQPPAIKGWKLTDHLSAYNERKLFTLNTGHAIAAYLGYLRGLPTIDAAIADPDVRKVVRGAMEESGRALVKKHGFKPAEHAAYMDKIEQRFANKAVRDEVARVGRQPLRKLGKEDRLVGPTLMAREYGVEVNSLPVGIAAALRYEEASDEQSVKLQKDIKEKGIDAVVSDVTGFEKGSDEHGKIVKAYHELESFGSKKD